MLKKILVFPCCFFLLLGVYAFNDKPVFFGYAERFEIYLLNASSTAQIVEISEKDYKAFNGIKGESCKIQSENFSVEKFFSEFCAEIIFEEHTAFGTSYYGFSPKIKYRKQILDKTVNLHIFVGESGVTVGSPIIFGSF